MIESRRPEHYEDRQPVMLSAARQSPIPLSPLQESLFLKLSTRMGQNFSGPELLRFGWSRSGLTWNDPDKRTQSNNRQHVIGTIHELRKLLLAHGKYIIDPGYGGKGWRLREISEADRVELRKQGYFYDSYAEHELTAQPERPALESGQEPSRAPAQSSEERSDEHHRDGVPLSSDNGVLSTVSCMSAEGPGLPDERTSLVREGTRGVPDFHDDGVSVGLEPVPLTLGLVLNDDPLRDQPV